VAADTTPQPDQPPEPVEKTVLGMDLAELTDALRSDLGLDAGATGLVVADVDEASEAWEKGLRAGDMIVEAGQSRVTTIAEFEERIAAARDGGRQSILLLIRREGDPRFVALSVAQ